MEIAKDLEGWLRKEAGERMRAAESRRGYASAGENLTNEGREAAHKITEQMLGRKISKSTRTEELNSARIQKNIASKLDKEAEMLIRFADFVAGEF